MANVKFSGFTSQETLSDTDEVVGLSGGANSRWLGSAIKSYTAPFPSVTTLPDTVGPGGYTLAACGIQLKNSDGVEVLRIWATDPDLDNDFNSANLYIGAGAGASQPTDNVDAGYSNVGVGASSLSSSTLSTYNTSVGSYAMTYLVDGSAVTGIGSGCGASVDASANSRSISDLDCVFVGAYANRGPDVANDVPIENSIVIGHAAAGKGSNTAVLGNDSITDTYLKGNVHGASVLVFPDADPHVAGAAYWVAGVLTKSAG